MEAECSGGFCSKCRGREDKLGGSAEDQKSCRGRKDKVGGSAEDQKFAEDAGTIAEDKLVSIVCLFSKYTVK